MTARAGDTVPLAGGTPHTIRNESDADAVAFMVHAPGAPMEDFSRAAADLAARAGAGDRGRARVGRAPRHRDAGAYSCRDDAAVGPRPATRPPSALDLPPQADAGGAEPGDQHRW